jgi:hypothetical protein
MLYDRGHDGVGFSEEDRSAAFGKVVPTGRILLDVFPRPFQLVVLVMTLPDQDWLIFGVVSHIVPPI